MSGKRGRIRPVASYVFYGVTGRRVPDDVICRSSIIVTFLSLSRIAGNRALLMPGERITSVFRCSRRLTGRIFSHIPGVTHTVRHSDSSVLKLGVLGGGHSVTCRSIFRSRVRFLPHCRSSSSSNFNLG